MNGTEPKRIGTLDDYQDLVDRLKKLSERDEVCFVLLIGGARTDESTSYWSNVGRFHKDAIETNIRGAVEQLIREAF